MLPMEFIPGNGRGCAGKVEVARTCVRVGVAAGAGAEGGGTGAAAAVVGAW